MAASAAISSVSDVQAFFTEYFGAWQGTDIDHIMSYYSDGVSLVLAGTAMDGKDAVEVSSFGLSSRGSRATAISRRT